MLVTFKLSLSCPFKPLLLSFYLPVEIKGNLGQVCPESVRHIRTVGILSCDAYLGLGMVLSSICLLDC